MNFHEWEMTYQPGKILISSLSINYIELLRAQASPKSVTWFRRIYLSILTIKKVQVGAVKFFKIEIILLQITFGTCSSDRNYKFYFGQMDWFCADIRFWIFTGPTKPKISRNHNSSAFLAYLMRRDFTNQLKEDHAKIWISILEITGPTFLLVLIFNDQWNFATLKRQPFSWLNTAWPEYDDTSNENSHEFRLVLKELSKFVSAAFHGNSKSAGHIMRTNVTKLCDH